MIKGKTPEEIRKTFHIKNDFTPSGEEQMGKENEWYEKSNLFTYPFNTLKIFSFYTSNSNTSL